MVKEFLWTNPHSSFKVEVPGADGGEAKVWFIEMNATSNLVQEGWKKNTIKARRQGHRHGEPTARRGRPEGGLSASPLPNGSKLGTAAAPAGGAASP